MAADSFMSAAIRFIEANINDELILEKTINSSYVSLRQFYRDFYSYTGHTVKEYIRKRRISNACAMIKYGNIPLTDIALSSGYQTQQSFNKQFKNVIGLTPLEYKNSDSIYFFCLSDPEGNSITVQVAAEHIPGRTVQKYYSSKIDGIEDMAVGLSGVTQGSIFGKNGKQTNNKFCYELMIPTDNNADLESYTGIFATCTVRYNEHDINNAWDYLYNYWLPRSLFEPTNMEYFEEYKIINGSPSKLKLYIPVRKKAEYQMMHIGMETERSFLIARKNGAYAKQSALKCLKEFLYERYPSLINKANLFICEYNDVCEYGIQIDSLLKLPDNEDLCIVKYPKGAYLALHTENFFNPAPYIETFDMWMKQNNMYDNANKTFTVYKYDETTGNTKMTVYRRILDGKKG